MKYGLIYKEFRAILKMTEKINPKGPSTIDSQIIWCICILSSYVTLSTFTDCFMSTRKVSICSTRSRNQYNSGIAAELSDSVRIPTLHYSIPESYMRKVGTGTR